MTTINAEGFEDYIQQSVHENSKFIEDVEFEIINQLPGGKAYVDADLLSAQVRSFSRENGTVDIYLRWEGEYEDSDLTIFGDIVVRAGFVGKGKMPAELSLELVLSIDDDFSK